jgi:Na+-driven multidrug efflux pump
MEHAWTTMEHGYSCGDAGPDHRIDRPPSRKHHELHARDDGRPDAVCAVVLSHVAPEAMIQVFSNDPAAVTVGEEYLRIVSWNFVASGLVFVSSSMFQAIGNTLPPLMTSLSRILLIAVPLYLLSRMPGFELRWIWYLSVAAVAIQMTLNLLLLMREFRIRLRFAIPSSLEATG